MSVSISSQAIMPSSLIKFNALIISIPTIGIGSSSYCDGQILVTDDMIGLSGFYPKFVKKYADINNIIDKASKKYSSEVKSKKFPSKKNFFI